MKADLAHELKGSIGSVEKEILQIKAHQTKLDDLGRAATSEQKRVDQQLAHSAQLLHDHKERLNRQLDQHQAALKDLVQRSVGEALKKRKAEQDAEMKRQRQEQQALDEKLREDVQRHLREVRQYKTEVEAMRRAADTKDKQILELRSRSTQADAEKRAQEAVVEQLRAQIAGLER